MIRNLIFFLVLFFVTTHSFSQNYNIDDWDGITIITCQGNFYDSGGSGGVYSANEDYTTTICPDNPDTQQIILDFDEFATQVVADAMIIYDGNSTSATQFGVFSGTNASSSPGIIQASNPSGCLTISFFSNGAAHGPGWEATIDCYEPCQNVTAAIESSPQPDADGSIYVDVDEEIMFTGIGTFSNGIETNAEYSWDWDDGGGATGITPGNHILQLEYIL